MGEQVVIVAEHAANGIDELAKKRKHEVVLLKEDMEGLEEELRHVEKQISVTQSM
jgi:hypothetical protein